MLTTRQELMLNWNKDVKDFVDNFTDGARNRIRYSLEIEEILKGLDNGLTLDQVKIYASREFNAFEMEQIRLGLEHGLSVEQAGVYAKPEFLNLMRIRCTRYAGDFRKICLKSR